MNGGGLVAEALVRHGVRALFTLCGGHISPVLVECKRRGIRIVDTRHEVNAVFAADATARLNGHLGVAAVTAGPGATNAVTAIKNAQLAHSPVLLLGGATATLLRNRGALQDIDQLALFKPHVKRAISVARVRDLPGAIDDAIATAQEGAPGPVFVECPVDLLYPEDTVRAWYATQKSGRLVSWYLERHLNRLFAGGERKARGQRPEAEGSFGSEGLRDALNKADRPLLLLGSQAAHVSPGAVEALGIPTFLAGAARGLLGPNSSLQVRHHRKEALREADLVILAGVPCDFRLGYGRDINREAFVAGVNRSRRDLRLNRKPDLAIEADPAATLEALARGEGRTTARWAAWIAALAERDRAREREIERMSGEESEGVNPLQLCREIDAALDDDSVIVADGGDFVGTASYIVRPRRPLSWLDPGAFGTLGVGAGFAMAARVARPESEVWILYGDGSVGFSIAELDTFVRHRMPVIAIVGNDACWTQIAREQVEILGDDVGCALARTDYHRVAEGFGAKGIVVRTTREVGPALAQAKAWAREGFPVLVNAHLGKTEFRKGSISI